MIAVVDIVEHRTLHSGAKAAVGGGSGGGAPGGTATQRTARQTTAPPGIPPAPYLAAQSETCTASD